MVAVKAAISCRVRIAIDLAEQAWKLRNRLLCVVCRCLRVKLHDSPESLSTDRVTRNCVGFERPDVIVHQDPLRSGCPQLLSPTTLEKFLDCWIIRPDYSVPGAAAFPSHDSFHPVEKP